MSKILADKIIIVQAWPMLNAYFAWLDLEHHDKLQPTVLNDEELMITYGVDIDNKHYRHKAVWTIHGLDRIYQIKAECAHHECQAVNLIYDGDATLEQLQSMLNIFTADVAKHLLQHCTEIGMDPINLQFY